MSIPRVPIATTIEPCVTSQWNFPHDRSMPWAKDGVCSICGQSVEMVRVGEDNPNLYSHIAKPHTREVTLYVVKDYDLPSDDYY